MTFTQPEQSALQDLFKTGWEFLTAAKNRLKKKPWILVIGQSHSGKTTLITRANLNIVENKHLATHPAEEGNAVKRCNWWFSADGIILDIPGSYLNLDAQAGMIHWPLFLQTLKKYIRSKTPTAIILALDIKTLGLQDKNEQQTQTQHLKQILYQLYQHMKVRCPLHLVLTKTDKVMGFNEFFADLGEEELHQICGIHLAPTMDSTATNLVTLFKTQFDNFIKRLQNRVIPRLHQERNEQKRLLIQHFPIQLESLKLNLSEFIHQLTAIFKPQEINYLRGIYFTSSIQSGGNADFLQKTITQTLALSTVPTQSTTALLRQPPSHFLQQLFKKLFSEKIATQRYPMKVKQSHKSGWPVYVSLAALTIGFSSWMAHGFITSVSDVNSVQKALTEYASITNEMTPGSYYELNQTLPALNDLQRAVILLKDANLPWFFTQGLHQQNLLETAEKAYHNALISYFLPNLGALLQQPLMNASDPYNAYGALKTYLMLGDPRHFDPNYVNSWLTHYWQRTLPNNSALQKELMTHLTALLSQPIPPLQLNQQTITAARNLLGTTDNAKLAYTLLKNNFDTLNSTSFPADKDQQQIFNEVFGSDHANFTIPAMFTAAQFQEIYFHKLNDAVNTLLQGDWVLGKDWATLKSDQNKRQLTTLVQILYLTDYANFWQTFIASYHIAPWESWQQAETVLTLLANKESPLITLLKQLTDNTDVNQLLPANSNISAFDMQIIDNNLINKFSAINNFLTGTRSRTAATMDHLLEQIGNLQNYLHGITAAADSHKAAFIAAKTNAINMNAGTPIQNLIGSLNTTPIPLSNWLNSLTSNSWRLILEQTSVYLNDAWQNNVLSFYNAKLNNRYPLFKNSHQDATLKDFSQFFANGGILDSFYNSYLLPFINTTQSDWQVRTLYGQSLKLSPNLLSQYERAGIIRSMFFDKQGQLDVNFSLRPVSMEPGVAGMTLTINDQSFHDKAKKMALHILKWPSLNKSSNVTLVFETDDGDKSNAVETGPWALFRLLEKANLQPSQNSQYFTLTFDLDGNAAQYQLIANNIINPFIPDILDQYRCPLSVALM